MDGLSAQAEADRPESGQPRGWMRSRLGRVIPEPRADLVSTARFLSKVLPEVARELGAIGTHVAPMDPEMGGMHSAVRRIHGEIKSLNGLIDELSEHMAGVETAVTRLQPHIAYVNLAMRPLRRARARLPRSATS